MIRFVCMSIDFFIIINYWITLVGVFGRNLSISQGSTKESSARMIWVYTCLHRGHLAVQQFLSFRFRCILICLVIYAPEIRHLMLSNPFNIISHAVDLIGIVI